MIVKVYYHKLVKIAIVMMKKFKKISLLSEIAYYIKAF